MKARVQKFVSMILVLLLCVSPLLGTNNVYASDDGNSNAYGTEETSKANNIIIEDDQGKEKAILLQETSDGIEIEKDKGSNGIEVEDDKDAEDSKDSKDIVIEDDKDSKDAEDSKDSEDTKDSEQIVIEDSEEEETEVNEDSAPLNDDVDLSAEFYNRFATDGAAANNNGSKAKTSRLATLLSAMSMTRMSAEITKRAQWTDESNGDGKITLQYSSNSGTLTGMKDLNVVLIQDKSGSMDANYGYNISVKNEGWSETPDESEYYPIDPKQIVNGQAQSETVSDIAKDEGEGNYFYRLNHKDRTDPNGHWGYNDYWLHSGQMSYNSPCQVDDHYYLLIHDDTSGDQPLSAWSMVHGNNLYNISATDLHHYVKLSGRPEALDYLAQGRRVVRMTSGSYYNESGREVAVSSSSPAYFLDVTHLDRRGSYWILNTCAEQECQDNDRLSRSQEFMDRLVDEIHSRNADNKIAYVPFWGDVPNNGSWSNASSNGTTSGLYPDNSYGDTQRLTHEDGVTKINFTTNYNTIKDQIDDDFTYDGTNWARAFQATIDFLNDRSEEDKQKETLIIFLTDGVPQGTSGDPLDVDNPKINGVNEIAELKSMEGVTMYACGVCVSQMDKTIAPRLNNIDTSGDGATFARVLSEFGDMEQKILTRLEEQYQVTISGNNAFYSDTLSGPFALDKSKLDANWIVLATPSSATTYGVPSNVYDAAKSAKYVYVQSTKTVYWRIGDMTNGTFTASGHSMSFPITYADYDTSTGGSDKKIESNTRQMLTFVTTQNPNALERVTMSSPTIIFNRQDKGQISVNMTAASAWDTSRTYRYVYTSQAQSGTVSSSAILGQTSAVLPAGQTSVRASFTNLNPGSYYVYRVDENHTIIGTGQRVSVSENAAITTEPSSTVVPRSATTSDGSVLQNLDNVLRIKTTSATVSFEDVAEYVDVDVTKVWNDNNYAGRPKEVTVWLLRNGTRVESMKLSDSNGWKGTFEDLDKYDTRGNEYQYTVEEEEVLGYDTTIEHTGDYSYRITNELLYGSIKLRKFDTDGKTPLSGAVFELKNSKGTVVSTKTSDNRGEVLFENLIPDTYTVTETKTTAGHTLLKEPLKVTVPMQLTEQEVIAQGIDKDKCVYYPDEGVYLIYDFTYEITNNASFDMPVAGGLTDATVYLPLAAGLAMFACIGVIAFSRKRKAE